MRNSLFISILCLTESLYFIMSDDEDSRALEKEEIRLRKLLMKSSMGQPDLEKGTSALDRESDAFLRRDSQATRSARKFLGDLEDARDKDTIARTAKPGVPIDSIHEHDSGLNKVYLGGPPPKPPKKPTTSQELHKQLAQSLISRGQRDDMENKEVVKLTRQERKQGSVDLDFSPKHHDDASPLGMKNFGKLLLYVIGSTLLFLLLACLVVSLLYVVVPSPNASQDTQISSSALLISPGAIDETRLETLKTILQEYSSISLLDTKGTAQKRAMKWIYNQDPAGLIEDDEFLPSRYALAVLFFETSGYLDQDVTTVRSKWKHSDFWLSREGYCKWHGVTCLGDNDHFIDEGNGKIFQLDLSANGLEGTIPSELVMLSDLFKVNLNNNNLSGTIPSDFGRSTVLRDLYLEDNLLDGTIPDELESMRAIRKLSLGSNNLTGSIPRTIVNLMEIRYLNFEKNKLVGSIPESMGQLSKIETLHLSHNKLTGSLPESFYKMKRLVYVLLSQNELSGSISTSLVQLSHLEKVHLVSNQFTGTIPNVFERIFLLEELHLQRNNFSGEIPYSLGKQRRLKELSVEENNLAGSMPDSICNLTKGGKLIHLVADCGNGSTTSSTTLLDLSNIQVLESRPMTGAVKDVEVEKESSGGVKCVCCTECM